MSPAHHDWLRPVRFGFKGDRGSFQAQKSNLLAAFYPGYILAMLPAGWAVQRFGPKLLLGLDNYLQVCRRPW